VGWWLGCRALGERGVVHALCNVWNVIREDTAYSCMGIFNVSGEGAEHAFLRLVKEILNSNYARQSLRFQTGGLGLQNHYPNLFSLNSASASVLSPSPKSYITSSKIVTYFYPSSTPITLSHLGLRVPVLLMPAMNTIKYCQCIFSQRRLFSHYTRLGGGVRKSWSPTNTSIRV